MSTTHRVLYLLGPELVELREEAIPRPGAGELLLRVEAATTCGTDLKVFLRGGHPRMLKVPTPFGHEVAGRVAATGTGVSRFCEGDRLVVVNSASCGTCGWCQAGRENLCEDLQYLNGAYADHLLVPRRFVERSTYPAAAVADSAVAAMAEPLACVHHGLSACGEVAGLEVILLGAGPIGLMFVRELSHCGARVIAGDAIPERLAVARRLGAQEAVRLGLDDSDGEKLRAATEQGKGAPLVVEATGSPLGWSNAMLAVRTGGTAVLFGGCAPGTTVACDSHRLHYSELTLKGVYHHRPATVRSALARLAEAGDDFRLLLSEERPLAEVELALRHMAERRTLKAAIRPAL